jgi:hypothetical protein
MMSLAAALREFDSEQRKSTRITGTAVEQLITVE